MWCICNRKYLHWPRRLFFFSSHLPSPCSIILVRLVQSSNFAFEHIEYEYFVKFHCNGARLTTSHSRRTLCRHINLLRTHWREREWWMQNIHRRIEWTFQRVVQQHSGHLFRNERTQTSSNRPKHFEARIYITGKLASKKKRWWVHLREDRVGQCIFSGLRFLSSLLQHILHNIVCVHEIDDHIERIVPRPLNIF